MTLWLSRVFFNYPPQLRGIKGDEIKLADHFSLPEGSIVVTTGILGGLIAAYVILSFIPKDKIIPFCVSGFLGGISGFVLWLKILGPVVMP